MLRHAPELAAAAIAVAVLTGCSGSDTAQRSDESPTATSTPTPADPWADQDRVNVLILGSDDGPNRTGERTDTMIVASVDTKTGNTALIGLPRNVKNVLFKPGTPMAERFPNGFPEFAFGIFTYAQSHPEAMPGSDTPGADLLKETIGYNLGLTIDYYALVNMQGFRDIVDGLGGLSIRVAESLPAGSGTLPAGLYDDMNGYETLWYARSRESTSDYDRMERQRCVLAAIVRQVEPETILALLPVALIAGKNALRTDISGEKLTAFAILATRVADAEIMGITLGPSLIGSEHPDWDAAKAATQSAIAVSAAAHRVPDQPKTEARDGELQSLDAVCQFS